MFAISSKKDLWENTWNQVELCFSPDLNMDNFDILQEEVFEEQYNKTNKSELW